MRRELRTYLADILQCIADIRLFLGEKTVDEYECDLLTKRAVEREFTIIADALARIGRISPGLQLRVSHVREIADFRNVIVHSYDTLDDTYVWKVVHESVPILKQQIDAWLAELEQQP